jgi:hypothetical protein
MGQKRVGGGRRREEMGKDKGWKREGEEGTRVMKKNCHQSYIFIETSNFPLSLVTSQKIIMSHRKHEKKMTSTQKLMDLHLLLA